MLLARWSKSACTPLKDLCAAPICVFPDLAVWWAGVIVRRAALRLSLRLIELLVVVEESGELVVGGGGGGGGGWWMQLRRSELPSSQRGRPWRCSAQYGTVRHDSDGDGPQKTLPGRPRKAKDDRAAVFRISRTD